jgi:hypothetical protein
LTTTVKDVITRVAERIGGVERMKNPENERLF